MLRTTFSGVQKNLEERFVATKDEQRARCIQKVPKAERIQWVGHAASMQDNNSAKLAFVIDSLVDRGLASIERDRGRRAVSTIMCHVHPKINPHLGSTSNHAD